jgi:protein-disulfide isomerase
VSPGRRTALGLAALLLLGAGPSWAAAAKTAAPAGVPADAVNGDMSLGNPKAPVHVVEYASASCPHCAHFDEETFPAFKAKYVDTGRVYYTLKEYLTAPPEVAAAGFILARCGGKAKYFAILGQVFRSQAQWASGDISQIFLKIGQANGLSEAKVKACYADQKALDALNARVIKAVKTDKVSSTPTFDINGTRVEGAVPLSDLDAAIAKAEKALPAKGGRR